MTDKIEEFRRLVAKVGGEIPVDRLETMVDLFTRREQTLAVELLIDNLHDFEVVCAAEDAALLKTIAKYWRLSANRIESIDDLTRASVAGNVTHSSATQGIFETLLNLPAPEDFVREAKANQVGDLLIVRALRSRFGMSFEEAARLVK